MIRRRSLGMALVLGAFGFGACDDATGFELSEVSIVPDRFDFAVSDLERYTSSREYRWSNSGAVVSVYQNTDLTGNAELVILDAGGAQVYSRSLADNGTFESTAGTPGAWTIRIAFSRATGTVLFHVRTEPSQSP